MTNKRVPFALLSINISDRKGIKKRPVDTALLRENYGIEGDAHAGDWHRQVSLLADEAVDTMRGKGAELNHGDFAENLTTSGVPLSDLPVGTVLSVGDAVLEITQIGKECHQGCAIFRLVGDCVMPRKGIFAKVIKGGRISNESQCYYNI